MSFSYDDTAEIYQLGYLQCHLPIILTPMLVLFFSLSSSSGHCFMSSTLKCSPSSSASTHVELLTMIYTLDMICREDTGKL